MASEVTIACGVLVERLEWPSVPNLTVSYTLEESATVLPGLLVRFVALAVLFRLNSPKKWRLTLEEELLPQPVQRWLGTGELAEVSEETTVDWVPSQVFIDTLSCRSSLGGRSGNPRIQDTPIRPLNPLGIDYN